MLELHNVRMFQGFQDFCFLSELHNVHILVFFDYLRVNLVYFHCNSFSLFQVECLVNLSESAFPKRFQYLVALVKLLETTLEHIGNVARTFLINAVFHVCFINQKR